MDMPRKSKPAKGKKHLLSNLPDSQLTSRSPSGSGHGHSVYQKKPASAPMLPLQPEKTNHAGVVISKIEDIFESIADCLLGEKKELTIQLKSRTRRAETIGENQEESQISDETAVRRRRPRDLFSTITFPSKSPQEAWKFTALLRILELSHEALITGMVVTKRDIYYKDPELFLRQAIVDRYVDDIAFTLGVERDALNVVAAAKGLVAGSFKTLRKDGSQFDYSHESDGSLIPNSKELESLDLTYVNWILVVEKEATFHTLATSWYWRDSLAGKGMIITAKGYPDIQTRQFLSILAAHFPHIPILALVDFDPDGLGITSTYKHGSVNLAHEGDLAVTSIKWLGVRSQDFLQLSRENDLQGLLKLTARDRRIATRMLAKEDVFGEKGVEPEWRHEVQTMLMLNVKAEIQILGNGEALGNWLDLRLMDIVGVDQ